MTNGRRKAGMKIGLNEWESVMMQYNVSVMIV